MILPNTEFRFWGPTQPHQWEWNLAWSSWPHQISPNRCNVSPCQILWQLVKLLLRYG